MCRNKFAFLFLPIILSINFFATRCYGQNVLLDSIVQLRQGLEKTIEFTSTELQEVRERNTDLADEYNLLLRQMQLRDSLSSILTQELELTDASIDTNLATLDELNEKEKELRHSYHEVLRLAYRYKLMKNDWLYILSAKSLNDGVLRYRYLKQFESFFLKESDRIQSLNTHLNELNHELDSLRQSQNQNLELQKELITLLANEIKDKKTLIQKMRRDQASIRKKIRSRNEVKKKSAEILGKPNNNLVNNAEEKKESGNRLSAEGQFFQSLKGKMIWPVEEGIIVEWFGRRPHDVVKNIWIENNGVGIRTRPGQNVKAVAQGIVKHTPQINTAGYMVIIAHGEYITSYFSLASIFVNKGDQVSEGQIIGQLSNSYNITPSLNFEIWQGYEKLNPEYWLQKK